MTDRPAPTTSSPLVVSRGTVQHAGSTWSVMTLAAVPARRCVLAIVIDRSDSLADVSELNAVMRATLESARRAWFNQRHPVWVYRLSDPTPLDGPTRTVTLDRTFDDDAGRRVVDEWVAYAALPSDRDDGDAAPSGRTASLLWPVVESIGWRRDAAEPGVPVVCVVLTDGRLHDATPVRVPPNLTLAGIACGGRMRSSPAGWSRALGRVPLCASPADAAIAGPLAAHAQPFDGTCLLRFDRRKTPPLYRLDAAGPRAIDGDDVAVTLGGPETPATWALAWQDYSAPADWDLRCHSEFANQNVRLADATDRPMDVATTDRLRAWLTIEEKPAADPHVGVAIEQIIEAGSGVFAEMLDALKRMVTERRGQTLAAKANEWRAGPLLPRPEPGEAALLCWRADGPVDQIDVKLLRQARAPFELTDPAGRVARLTVSEEVWAATPPGGGFVPLASQPQVLLPFLILVDGVTCRAAFVELKGRP